METLLEPRARRAPVAHSPRHTALSPSVVAIVDSLLINLAFFLAWYA